MCLHGNSDFLTWLPFFAHINGLLQHHGAKTFRVVGTDEVKALIQAIESAFKYVNRLICTLHLKENAIRYLQDKVGATCSQRKNIINKIFGKD